MLEQQVVVPASLAIVAELVVPQGQVVEALPSTLRSAAEDLREKSDALLLVRPRVGFNQTLVRQSARCLSADQTDIPMRS